MSPNTRFSPIFLFLLGAASFVIVVAGMQSASSLLNAFFLSLIIVISVSPLLGWLVRKGLSPKLALLLTILLVLGIGASLMAFLGVSINQLIHILPTYEARISAIKDSLVHFFAAKGINLNNTMGSDVLQPSNLLKGAVVFIQRIGEAIASSLLLLLIVAFMLIESTSFPSKLRRVFEPEGVLLSKLTAFSGDIRKYMMITAWTGALAAFGDFLVLLVLGVDLAPLWGVMFFLLSFIPGVGFLLAVIPPVLLALLEHDGLRALLVFVGCLLVDNIVDKAIKPRYMQEGLDLSILVIILSILFWSWVLGPTGAILSVPLTMMVKKLVLESSEETRFIALLMGAGNTEKVTTNHSASEDENG